MLPIIRTMIRRHRRARIDALLQELEEWDAAGRVLLSSVLELTEHDDDLAAECRRVLEALDR